MWLQFIDVGAKGSIRMRHVASLFVAAGLAVVIVSSSFAAERVGEATLVKTTVTGDRGTIRPRSPVHQDERIRTSDTGLGEFLFRDGSKFAVGRNSSVVIDKFVFDDKKTAKSVSVKAAKGTFRWISGGSNPSAHKVITPAGTLGIRG